MWPAPVKTTRSTTNLMVNSIAPLVSANSMPVDSGNIYIISPEGYFSKYASCIRADDDQCNESKTLA
jgi:hypothetical protein